MSGESAIDKAMKAWWLWNEDQRKHFLLDRKLNVKYASRNNWSDIPDNIQNAVIEHIKSKK